MFIYSILFLIIIYIYIYIYIINFKINKRVKKFLKNNHMKIPNFLFLKNNFLIIKYGSYKTENNLCQTSPVTIF